MKTASLFNYEILFLESAIFLGLKVISETNYILLNNNYI